MAIGWAAATMDVEEPVILIGFAEALAAIEVAWSLQRAGFKVVAFQRAGSRRRCGAYTAWRLIRFRIRRWTQPPPSSRSGTSVTS